MAPLTLSSGIFIPAHKKFKFLLVFKEPLLNAFSLIPFFVNTSKFTHCNSYEIQFKYIGKVNQERSSVERNLEKAKKFIRGKMHLLTKRRELSSAPEKSIQVVDLVDEEVGTEMEPEIIVLDETLNQLDRTCMNLNATLNDLDDVTYIGTSKLLRSPRKLVHSSENDLQIVNVIRNKNNNLKRKRKITPCKISLSNNDLDFISIDSKPVKRRREEKHTKKHLSSNSTPVRISNKKLKTCKTLEQKRTRSSQKKLIYSMTTDHNEIKKTKPRKNSRKLKDISNCSLTASPLAKPVSDNVLKYYKNMEKVFDKMNESNKKKKKPKNVSPKINQQIQRRRQETKIRQMNAIVGKTKRCKSSPRDRKLKHNKESNIFNPNPIILDNEGLRPIVIDGCNVAIRHGKGTFSVKGLMVCVEYFVNRGHNHIKVFMPQHRQQHFTEAELAQLRTKCDVVFTPSRLINGIIKTSYDDRFIVQYAAEFKGVIVSTDNYRDLLSEHPRWKETIHQRLLMFTWVDDFLMFPMDPLGRRGPTLEQFLRF